MSPAPPVSERRQKRRIPMNLRVDWKVGEHVGAAQTVDLSENGVFLNTHKITQTGERVYLRIHLSLGGPQVKAVGAIRRIVKPGEGSLPGVGVQFETIYADRQDVLRKFLTQGMGLEVKEQQMQKADVAEELVKYTFDPKEMLSDAYRQAGSGEKSRKVDDKMALKELEFHTGFANFFRHYLKIPTYFAIAGAILYFLMDWAFDALQHIMDR